MNIEDIKIGETYNVRVKVDRVDTTFNAVFFTIEGGDTVYAFGVQDRKIHDLISPVIEVTGVCPPSKYDPCRLFRKGDKVRVVEWNGRRPWCEALLGKETTVLHDESSYGVRIQIGESVESYCTLNACFLELVTPVEEVEPYTVVESYGRTDIMKDDYVITTYTDSHPHAKKSAEDECDRLNEEYRKEQK